MKKNKCKHFTGVQNTTCRAGVKYDDVRGTEGDRRAKSLPCLVEFNTDNATCEKCQFPTDEEIAEWNKWVAERFGNMAKARESIVAHLGGPWKKGMKGSAGVIDCPCCGKPGYLQFTRSGYNGHIHAKCKTIDCVSWVE